MKSKRFVAVIGGILVSALICVTAGADEPKEWDVVRVTDDEAMVAECVLVGEVKGKSSFGGWVAQNLGEEKAYKHLKRNAWEMGGNTVLMLFGRSGFGGSKFRGEAYRCDEGSGQVPELIVLGGVGLCGPSNEAIAYLSATIDEGVGSPPSIKIYDFEMPMQVEYGGLNPTSGRMVSIGELVSNVSIKWQDISKADQKQVWKELREGLTASKGQPDSESPTNGMSWVEANNRKVTQISWNRELGYIKVTATCNDQQAKAAMQEARDSDKPEKIAAF